MSIVYELPAILLRAGEEYRRLLREAEENLQKRGLSSLSDTASEDPVGYFEVRDNALFLAEHIADGTLAGKLDLIYIDPPFFSEIDQDARIEIKSTIYDKSVVIRFTAYKDTWGKDMSAYLFMLAVRLMLMRDVLSQTGSIFVHLDWHAVHAVKLMMDEIFGEKNFINEIIWTYKSGGAAKRHFSRKHDTILFYSKTDRYKFRLGKEKSYNRGLKPYRFKGVEEFHDDIGWYTLVNQKDVWQIDMVGRSSSERLNYATQKPEALLARIIGSATEEGDLAADFFCGSGTLAAAAAKAGRRFICTDISSMAVANAMKRPLRDSCGFALKIRSSSDDAANHTAAIEAVFHGGSVRLISYKNDAVFESDRKGSDSDRQLSELMEKDPLAFVDYWGVGFIDHSKERFYPETALFRDKHGILKTAVKLDRQSFSARKTRDGEVCCGEQKRELSEQKPVIFAVDIFGNIVFTQPAEC